jgi:hypothetical protein
MLSDEVLLFHLIGTDFYPYDNVLSDNLRDRASFTRMALRQASLQELTNILTQGHTSGKFIKDLSNVLLELPYPYKRGYYTTHNESDIETFYMSKGYYTSRYDTEGNDISEYVQLRKTRPGLLAATKRYLKNPSEYEQFLGLSHVPIRIDATPTKHVSHASRRVDKPLKEHTKTETSYRMTNGRQSKIDPTAWF